jgi:hypothetical protein
MPPHISTYSDFVVPTVSVDVGGFKTALGRKGGGGGRQPSGPPRSLKNRVPPTAALR